MVLMQAFIKTHRYLLDHLNVPVHRHLLEYVDWDHRLIGIQGARGVGKTTFLLDYAKTFYGNNKSCLYVNLNNLYFAETSVVDFADEFRKTGGKILLLDQIYKYPDWAEELRYCYDHFDDLKIVFSGSPLMRVDEGNAYLDGCARVYNLEGFTFREYLNLKTGNDFKPVGLNELLRRHEEIAAEVVDKVKPLAYFTDYLHHGYYPFFLEKRNHLENLLKTINLVLEIDISYLQQIELKYLPKLRKLLYIVGKSAPFQPNISRLSNDVETSRATIMNYLNYLRQGRLVNLLYEDEPDPLKKPACVYMHNPNLVFSVASGDVEMDVLHKTFFYNQVGYLNRVSFDGEADFRVNNDMPFYIGGRNIEKKTEVNNGFFARDMVEIGEANQIPLWLFGFLF
ncbi:AAA family ATPase [Anaerophaga thermohalophila]|uniref:AAA family ATPase n=1 Tax=Anaerophaga thermohalophila TaxID=177400 RepID=UPI000237CE3B|nr:AAA family ATPase [Anaerophaga thermohalophila]